MPPDPGIGRREHPTQLQPSLSVYVQAGTVPSAAAYCSRFPVRPPECTDAADDDVFAIDSRHRELSLNVMSCLDPLLIGVTSSYARQSGSWTERNSARNSSFGHAPALAVTLSTSAIVQTHPMVKPWMHQASNTPRFIIRDAAVITFMPGIHPYTQD